MAWTGGDVDGVPFDNRVDLHGRSHTWSVFATDTLSINNLWHATLSGRYNRTHIKNRDQIIPGGGVGSLDGDHTFSRFNPAAGLTFTPGRAFKAYFGYSEGSRAPSAIELGCADPNNPCRLPNSLAGDPPLKQVVTKTWELGFHGTIADGIRWNAGIFRAENHDDILFVAAPINTQFGYFKNFGKTRREGFEAGLSGVTGKLSLGHQLHLPGRDLPVHRGRQRRQQQQQYRWARPRRGQHPHHARQSHAADSAAYAQGLR